MVSTTFIDLNSDKKNKITSAILKEFSTHSLSDAKVSRIVADSGIARGAFYKYFEDLNDAYSYIYHLAIQDIHADFKHEPGIHYPTEKYVDEVTSFVNQVHSSQYFDLIKMHITTNEALVEHQQRQQIEQVLLQAHVDPVTWGIATLTHETIKLVLLYPESQAFLLKRYSDAIEKLNIQEDD
ncbi:TetR/AcrR family transcriptional regulator [Companilactobacillus sp.]|uniref:TetR/AcrR family transcriptional regulator n=1 Tax=Companilactobacillus sp. TaxID=2767905 RepID=UPI00262B0FAB|nr:TetR/AcrR family transcriptional regulator [Companilactobacillus sp.]